MSPASKGRDTKYLVEVNNSHSRPMMPGEPCFVFRPSDRFIVPVISHYLALCELGQTDRAHVQAILRHQRDIIGWQLAHPELVKQPD
jgi:hypothetical protein